MNTLKEYEQISGLKINTGKSSFYMYHNTTTTIFQEVSRITGLSKGQCFFLYLGCPIFHARKRKAYYNDIIEKVKKNVHVGKEILSNGGKVVRITNVLQSMHTYVLSAIDPSRCVIHDLYKILARFF